MTGYSVCRMRYDTLEQRTTEADIVFETGRIRLGHEVDNRTNCILFHAIYDIPEHGSLDARCGDPKFLVAAVGSSD